MAPLPGGNFFIYQGFNKHCGWMHTSSYADVADVYAEEVLDNGWGTRVDNDVYKIYEKSITLFYKHGDKTLQRKFRTYFTHHGPVMGKRNGKWLSLKEHNRSLSALMQSWLRTKTKGYADFKKVMEMRSNNSNNTVFADDKGNIAYWHGNFMPRRNPAYDWTMPVDGSTAETEWKGLHAVDETVHLYNPASGWIQNCNSTPFTAAGESSPKKEDYPAYMAPEGQNGRALNAVRLLSNAHDLTLEKVIDIGYNHYLSAFDFLLPPLFAAYDEAQKQNSADSSLALAIQTLKAWDKNASTASIATTLAVEWAFGLAAKVPPAKTPEAATNAVANFQYMADKISGKEKLEVLTQTINELKSMYGNWQIAWGDVNRYQRVNANGFSDTKESLPVGLGPGTWGSIPSFISRRFDTKNRYGVSGNSFIAAVEFGKKLKAKTIVTGGESFDPSSKHFTDQAEGYIEGKFKDVRFYKEDVLKSAERTYHPGE